MKQIDKKLFIVFFEVILSYGVVWLVYYQGIISEGLVYPYVERMVSCAYHIDQAVYEEALQESAGRNPTEENLFRLASFYLYVSKDYEKANDALDNMVHKWPFPKYQILLSYSFLRIGDNAAACDLLKHIPPKFRQPWGTQLLSKHYQEQGEWNKAIDVIKDYIKFYFQGHWRMSKAKYRLARCLLFIAVSFVPLDLNLPGISQIAQYGPVCCVVWEAMAFS